MSQGVDWPSIIKKLKSTDVYPQGQLNKQYSLKARVTLIPIKVSQGVWKILATHPSPRDPELHPCYTFISHGIGTHQYSLLPDPLSTALSSDSPREAAYPIAVYTTNTKEATGASIIDLSSAHVPQALSAVPNTLSPQIVRIGFHKDFTVNRHIEFNSGDVAYRWIKMQYPGSAKTVYYMHRSSIPIPNSQVNRQSVNESGQILNARDVNVTSRNNPAASSNIRGNARAANDRHNHPVTMLAQDSLTQANVTGSTSGTATAGAHYHYELRNMFHDRSTAAQQSQGQGQEMQVPMNDLPDIDDSHMPNYNEPVARVVSVPFKNPVDGSELYGIEVDSEKVDPGIAFVSCFAGQNSRYGSSIKAAVISSAKFQAGPEKLPRALLVSKEHIQELQFRNFRVYSSSYSESDSDDGDLYKENSNSRNKGPEKKTDNKRVPRINLLRKSYVEAFEIPDSVLKDLDRLGSQGMGFQRLMGGL